MGIIHSQVPPPAPALIEEPEIAESGEAGPRNITNSMVSNVREEIVNEW